VCNYTHQDYYYDGSIALGVDASLASDGALSEIERGTSAEDYACVHKLLPACLHACMYACLPACLLGGFGTLALRAQRKLTRFFLLRSPDFSFFCSNVGCTSAPACL
jgi:hypothetical protein